MSDPAQSPSVLATPRVAWRYVALVLVPLAIALVATQFGDADAAPDRAAAAAGTLATAAHPAIDLSRPLPRFLLQLLVVLSVAKFAGWALRRVGQPAVVGEMAAGLLLGPVLFGAAWPQAQAWLFAPESLDALSLVSQLGVLMFLFVAGAELDAGAMRGQGRRTLLIGHAGLALPFLLGVGLAALLFSGHAPAGVRYSHFAWFLGASLSVTAFPVLLRILAERGLDATPVGRIATACAAFADASAWCMLVLIVAAVRADGWSGAALRIGGVMALVLFALLLLRPWLTARIVEERHHGRWMILLLTGALAFALLTELLHVHALFGAFLAGIAVSGNAGLRRLLVERIEPFALALLLPLFFAMTGLRLRPDALQANDWLLCLGVIGLASAGKFGGTWIAARWTGIARFDALRLGALMNTRGLMELVVLNLGYDLGLIGDRLFAVLTLMALVTTAMTGPWLGLLDRIEARSRRRAG